MVSAIVLAAGKSERMGRPKALLPIFGRTFLENILSAISRSSVRHTVVVVGHHREQIEPYITAGASLVYNADYESGMITSFQAGIRALPAGTSGALLCLADHPLLECETIEALIAHLAPDRIVVPVFQGRRGHPVLFASSVLEEILELSVDQGANIVVRKDPGRIIQVPVNSAGILVDVDTPEDFQRFRVEYESR
jgi:molybdenum cofactor cytidylyltransferase